MLIRLNDNTELNVVVINGATALFQNAQRDTLEIVFRKGEYPFDTLDAYFADKLKTRKLTIVDDQGNQFVYDDYVLRVSMNLVSVVVQPETSTTPEVREDRITVVMAQQTYMEKLVEQLLGV